jgi:DNA-directed RNA polymerase subunit RPC12/RpoP
MKPRTKLQVQVYDLSLKLPPLTNNEKQWAFKNCLAHIGYRTKSGISCLDCGHKWAGPQKVKSCKCPGCGVKLDVQDSRKKKLSQTSRVMAIIDSVHAFQVIRYFEIDSFHRAGEQPRKFISECVQKWFMPGGKLTVVAKGIAYGCSGFHGDMEIRAQLNNYYTSNKYNLFADKIYPKAQCLPIFSRNGFNTKIDNVYPYSLFIELLRNTKLETLMKAKQFGLVKGIMGDRNTAIHKFWNSIKICMRNNYIIEDAKTYLDYLELLERFGKDLRSPKYVCPLNLNREHNRYVRKQAKAVVEQRKLKAAEETISYTQEKEKFFGLRFSEGNIEIKVLESVEAFIEESEIHKHCVYTNKYYAKSGSLCFSAKVGGVNVETVEISLSTMKVVQSRGLHNMPSKHHSEIVALMEKNMGQVKNRMKQTRKQAA